VCRTRAATRRSQLAGARSAAGPGGAVAAGDPLCAESSGATPLRAAVFAPPRSFRARAVPTTRKGPAGPRPRRPHRSGLRALGHGRPAGRDRLPAPSRDGVPGRAAEDQTVSGGVPRPTTGMLGPISNNTRGRGRKDRVAPCRNPALLVKALWGGPGWRGARVRRITTLPIAGAKVPNCGRQSVWSDGTVGRSAARICHEWAAYAVDRQTKRA
jgi:hypothetical protein